MNGPKKTTFSLPNDNVLLRAVIARHVRGVSSILGSNFLIASFDNCQISQGGLDTALWTSGTQGTTRISNLISEFGGDIQQEKNGSLGRASRVGNLDEIDKLIKAGADVHSENEYALRMAMKYNKPHAAGLLCARGANMYVAARDVETMKMIADGGLEWADMRNFVMEKLRELPPPPDHKHNRPDNIL